MAQAQYLLSAGLEFFFAFISVILLFGCLLDRDRKTRTNQSMIWILSIHALMNAVDACVWLWCDVSSLLPLMKFLSFASYALGSALIMLFSYLLVLTIRECHTVPRRIDLAILVTGAVMTALWFVSLFNGMYYYWDETGACQTGRLFWLSQVFGIAFFLFDIALVLAYRKALGARDASVLILYAAIPLVSYIFVFYWEITPFYMATTIVLLLYYIVIHVEHGQRLSAQETLLVKQELELTNSRTAIVLSQIQPHFLYNSLTAIAQLCEKDPAKAKEMTLNFSEYLRSNMNSLDQKAPIPFEKELEHVQKYLAIEQVRFGEDLHIAYHIQATDFHLPPLTLQPLVENAVKHGVGMKEDGGTVTISTREAAGFYEVIVSDDGVGFDPEQIPTDGKKHTGMGMSLVRIRLETLVDGTMKVESRPGAGTTVTLCIPKKEEQS